VTIPYQILLLYTLWFAAVFYVHRLCRTARPGSVGIPISYLITMTFMHSGGLIYSIPGYTHLRTGGHWYLQVLRFTEEMVRDGVLASTICVVGIAVGCYLCSDKSRPHPAPAGPHPMPAGPHPMPAMPAPPPQQRRPSLARHAQVPLALLIGGMMAFAITKLNLNLPSLQSIIATGRNLAIVAVCLGLWLALQRRDRDSLKLWAAMTLIVPAAYLIGWGFVSYGFMAMAVFLGFWLSIPKPGRPKKVLQVFLIALGVYASLSIFVSYMEVRTTLREVLWNDDATFSQRVGVITTQLAKASVLNPFNFSQLDWINIRLNQNMLIGKAMALHKVAPYLQENGMGLLSSMFAWVPRFLWPSKQGMGGNDFVEKHTGMSFNDSTTIGTGPVFELFVNFGLIGVFLGSIALGWALRWMDAYCARQLGRRDIGRFIRGYLVSVCLINPMSLIFFFVSSASAAWVLGTGIMFALDMLQRRDALKRRRPGGPPREKRAWAS
jgi:hypothetical protein